MNPKACALIFSLFVLFSATNAFNITKILSNASDFSSFNDLLTQTGLAEKINSRSTITVLALDGGAVGSIQGKSQDEVRNILSNHVILDYYSIDKLKKLPNKTSTLTTLFQATGSAQPGQGFLHVTVSSSGDVMFGSGVKDAPLSSKAVKSVFSQPYNISVIQISEPIVAPGIGAASPQSEPSQAPEKAPRKSPSPSSGDDGDKAEAPSDDENMSPEDSPSSSPPAEDSSGDSPSPSTDGSGAASALSEGAVGVGVLMGLLLSFVRV